MPHFFDVNFDLVLSSSPRLTHDILEENVYVIKFWSRPQEPLDIRSELVESGKSLKTNSKKWWVIFKK